MDCSTYYFRYTFLPACYDLSDYQVRQTTYPHQAMSHGLHRLIHPITPYAENAMRREISPIASSRLIDSDNGTVAMARIDGMGGHDELLRMSRLTKLLQPIGAIVMGVATAWRDLYHIHRCISVLE